MDDYSGDMGRYQRRLEEAGVDFDVTLLAGATKREIEGVVDRLIAAYNGRGRNDG